MESESIASITRILKNFLSKQRSGPQFQENFHSDCCEMRIVDMQEFKVGRKAFAAASREDDSDEKPWHSRTPHERPAYVELLRRVNYGRQATAKLQRVFEVVECWACPVAFDWRMCGRRSWLAARHE